MYCVAVVGVIVALGLRMAFQDRGAPRRPATAVRPDTAARPTVGAGTGRRRQDG
ncbi:hypothetical protein ACFQ1I_42600 [Kitasatospora arboriphila]